MYSQSYINEQVRAKTKQAKKQKMLPYIAKHNEDEGVKICPFLGEYIPKGWQVTETFFVDNSGWGSENEPALTFNSFLSKVKAGYGYGIFEAGQFQVYIREFKRL